MHDELNLSYDMYCKDTNPKIKNKESYTSRHWTGMVDNPSFIITRMFCAGKKKEIKTK